MPATETATSLEYVSEGLTFQSGIDSPWVVFRWPSASGEPTAEGVLRKGQQRTGVPIEVRTIDELFAPLVEVKDWYGDKEKAISAKYRSLLTTIKSKLMNPKVVRIGATRITIYIVGQAKEGGWVGLKTTAVET